MHALILELRNFTSRARRRTLRDAARNAKAALVHAEVIAQAKDAKLIYWAGNALQELRRAREVLEAPIRPVCQN